MSYVGRFAPSPTGALHLGTLAAAVASYLHARRAGGRWLLRIEDIDPPREIAGAADDIVAAIELLELHWDGTVRYQSRQLDRILGAGHDLHARGLAYYCTCSRQQIHAITGTSRYPGTCRGLQRDAHDAALRVLSVREPVRFEDGIQGPVEHDIESADGDFVIVRRDGLPAYHLAVVVDDADQGITDVVRGADLLLSTPLHIHLQRTLGLPTPRYWHIPLLTDRHGEKLSKRSGAARIDTDRPAQTAARVLTLLGLAPPAEFAGAPPAELWAWAAGRYRPEAAGRDPVAVTDDA